MITLLYASLIVFLLIFLSVMIIVARVRGRVAIGDGGHETLRKRIRAHANLAEYAPLFLLILFLLEFFKQEPWVIHMLGASFFLGRAFHAYAFLVHEKYQEGKLIKSLHYRRIGMSLTFIPLLLAAGLGIGMALNGLVF